MEKITRIKRLADLEESGRLSEHKKSLDPGAGTYMGKRSIRNRSAARESFIFAGKLQKARFAAQFVENPPVEELADNDSLGG